MTILDRVQSPTALKSLTRDELRELAADIRSRLIDSCSRTGGHIGAGLGVVELAVALHAVFDTPRDQLVWDVGHQGYPHKLLTGRAGQMETLRQEGGSRDSSSGRRASTTPSARATPPPRSPPRSGSPRAATCSARRSRWWR